METLNINKEINKDINNKNQKIKLSPKINEELQLNKIKEIIKNNEYYQKNPQILTPTRPKLIKQKTRLENAFKVKEYYDIQNQPAYSLFNEESKSDDEENINDNKRNINEEEKEGRKSIYTKYNDDLINTIYESKDMDEIFDNTKYIKKLEEAWKYEKILLDYNIIDFSSK